MQNPLSLEGLKLIAETEAESTEINWDYLEDPRAYKELVSSLKTAFNRVPMTERLYEKLLPKWNTSEELTDMTFKAQDILVDAYVAQLLYERLCAVENVATGRDEPRDNHRDETRDEPRE